MKLLNKMERKFGRYAITGLMRYIVILFVAGLLIETLAPRFYDTYLALNFDAIAKGEVWRLVTFIIQPASMTSIIWFLIMVYFYYIIGNALENVWGAFRLNLYFFSGILFNILGYYISYLLGAKNSWPSCLEVVCGTLFFAYAAIFPNVQFLMYFLIPIKAKYLAWFQGAVYLLNVFGLIIGRNYIGVIPLMISLANFLIFFFATRNYNRISPSEIKRKATYRRQVNEARNQGNVVQFRGQNVITRHKCAVCGRTELDNDQLEFRFCSKCDGNYEYCMDHLFTHEHVHKSE